MNILGGKKPISFICTQDRAKAKAFYTEVLGLTLVSEDMFAAVFDLAGISLRMSTAPNFKPQEFTVLGFEVPDIEATVKALRAKGVAFKMYDGFGQDALGIWRSPAGDARVAWFTDPDGNLLSLTQF